LHDEVTCLLRSRDTLWERIRANETTGLSILKMGVFIMGSSALYGAVLAGWRSPRLALYVAVKFPILLLGTTSLVMLLNWLCAVILGSGMSFRQSVALTYTAMGVACWILLGLIPVTAFFTFGVASDGGTDAARRLTHNCLLLTHIALIGCAGVAGNAALRRGIARIVKPTCNPRRIYWCWLLAFALVGCQLSWILRPFIGSPFFEVRFIRPDALERNFFEFVCREVLPNVLRGG